MLKTAEEIKQFEKEISELDTDFQRYSGIYQESSLELGRLQISRRGALSRKREEIDRLLNDLPVDLSDKGALDKVYQLKPDPSSRQLDDNIERLEATCLLAKRKADAASKKKGILENEIHQNQIDKHVIEVFKKFEKWIEVYKNAESFFYNDLLTVISDCYLMDPFFHRRADALGLSPTIKVSIDSHFKQDSFNSISMWDSVDNIANLGDAYGERLLSKSPGPTMAHPLENKGYFNVQESEKAPLQDPDNFNR